MVHNTFAKGKPYMGVYSISGWIPMADVIDPNIVDPRLVVPGTGAGKAVRNFTVEVLSLVSPSDEYQITTTGEFQDYVNLEYDIVYDRVNGKRVNIDIYYDSLVETKRIPVRTRRYVRDTVEYRTCSVFTSC